VLFVQVKKKLLDIRIVICAQHSHPCSAVVEPGRKDNRFGTDRFLRGGELSNFLGHQVSREHSYYRSTVRDEFFVAIDSVFLHPSYSSAGGRFLCTLSSSEN